MVGTEKCCHVPGRVLREITFFAQKHGIERVILFGSRARGTNTERSDIDIAVSGGNIDGFYFDMKDNVHSLLLFDVVDLSNITDDLRDEIKKDGVTIYEKA